MTSGQETERVYSYNLEAHTGVESSYKQQVTDDTVRVSEQTSLLQ